MKSVLRNAFEESLIMPHQPDHELALRSDARIDAGMLQVLRLAIFFEKKIDLWMGFDA